MSPLAAAATTQAIRQTYARYAVGLVIIVALAIAGIVMIALLVWAWQRYNQRLQKRRVAEPMPDVWQAGGDRLAARLDQAHPPARGPADGVSDDDLPRDPDEEIDPDASDDDDDDAPGDDDDDDQPRR